MRRIKILSRALSPDKVEDIKRLAKDAGLPESEIQLIDAVGEPDPDCEDEIILITATPEICAAPELEADLMTTQRGGRRAICIWPNDAQNDTEPPAAMKKYAYSIIRFDAGQLRIVSADADQHCFETPGGQPLPTPKTERNLCVDEKASAS